MSETKRILIISDSLALPRSKPEEVLYEDTYPFMLRRDYEVFQISFGGGIIKEIVHQAHYYLPYKPDRYTKPSDFETSLYVLKKDFPNAKLLAIGIVPASNDYVKLIPGIDKSIVQYNAIIKRVVGPSFISLSELPTNAVMSDHHHINKIGHQFIYKNILGILRQDA